MLDLMAESKYIVLLVDRNEESNTVREHTPMDPHRQDAPKPSGSKARFWNCSWFLDFLSHRPSPSL